MIGLWKRETSAGVDPKEYLGVVTERHGITATADPLLPAWPAGFEMQIGDMHGEFPIGCFVYTPDASTGSWSARIVTGETLPRPDLWFNAVQAIKANMPGMLYELDEAREHYRKACEVCDREAKASPVQVVTPAGVADVGAADFGGGWIDELAVLAVAGRVYEIDRSSDLRAGGTVRGSWCAKFIGHINGVPVYEDPTLDGNEIAPVVVDLGKPVSRDPATTCSCGATKAHEQRVCGACFGRERRGVDPFAHPDPDRWPGQEYVASVRCPKCGTHDISARVEVAMWIRPNRNGAYDAYDAIGERDLCESLPRLVAMVCQSHVCGHSWTPPEHLHHNWVRL